MAKESLFRTSLNGFNKQDVTNYIEDLNIKYKRQSEQSQDEIKLLKKELEVVPQLLEEKGKTDELKAEIQLLKKENSDLNEAIKAQGISSAEKDQLLEEAFKENDLLKEELSRLKDDKIRILKNGGAEYDGNDAYELEMIFDNARKEAEQVIEKANYYAKQIIDDAKSKARQKTDEATRISNEAIRRGDEALRKSDEAVKDNLKKVKYLNRKKDELNDIFKNHKSKVDSFFTAISRTLNGDD